MAKKLTGNLIDTSGKPQGGAEVWLSAPGQAADEKVADDKGNFSFDIEGWPAGSYRLEAPPNQQALGAERTVQIVDGGPPPPQLLTVAPRYDTRPRLAGWLFLGAMFVALVGLAWLYFDLHGFSVERLKQGEATPVLEPLSGELSQAVDDALTRVEQALAAAGGAAGEEAEGAGAEGESAGEEGEAAGEDEGGVEEEEGEGEEGEESRGQAAAAAGGDAEGAGEGEESAVDEELAAGVGDSLTLAGTILARAVERRGEELDAGKVLIVESLLGRAGAELAAGDLEGLRETLKALQKAAWQRAGFFWGERPEILLETLFWALAATLIRLIFNAGYYLYKRAFLKTAIAHHLALLVSVPILAVLISFVLTLVEISIELSDISLRLDMDNVYIAILVAALIGFAPWKAWNFIQDLADALFTRLGRLFS